MNLKEFTPEAYQAIINSINNMYVNDYFDDTPTISPQEMILRLQAGGQIAEMNMRRAYYDDEEYEEWLDEYACDYVQRYKDLLEAKKHKPKSQSNEAPRGDETRSPAPEAQGADLSSVSKENNKSTVSQTPSKDS